MQQFLGLSLARAIWVLTGLFGAVVFVASASISWELRQARLIEVNDNLQHALPRATAAVNRTFLAVDVLFVTVAEQVRTELNRDSLVHREQLSILLRQITRSSLVVREIALFEQRGGLYRPSGASLEDRDAIALRLFAHNIELNSAASQLTISEPVAHFQNADSVMLIGKKIALPGDQQGVLVAVLPIAHVSAVIGSAAALPDSTIVLSNREFNSLATFPDALIPRPRGLLKDRHSTVPELLAVAGEPVTREAEVAAAAKTLYDDTSITVRYPLDKISQANTRAFLWILGVATTLFAIACLAASAFIRSMERLRQTGASVQRYTLWLNEAFQASSDGMLLCDADNKIRVWNRRFNELFPGSEWSLHDGLDFQNFLDTIQDANDGDSSQHARRLMVSELLATRVLGSSSNQSTIQLVGSERNVVSVQTIKLSDGATVSTFVDMTETDTKLRKAREEARTEFSKRSLYLREFSNRIARPVNTIAGGVELLKTCGDNYQELSRSIAIIDVSANELMLIHAQVLAFEKHLRERVVLGDAETRYQADP